MGMRYPWRPPIHSFRLRWRTASPNKEEMNFTHKVDHQHNTQLRLGIRPPNHLLQAARSMHHPQLRLNIHTT